MSPKKWYEELYSNFGEKYEEEPYVQGTKGEIDFIEGELGGDKEFWILDVGCGTGRHLLELARRGYKNLVGVDLSENMLEKAREKAEKEALDIEFIQADARELEYSGEFDAVLVLCEGAFSLMETDEMDYKILQNISRALKGGGRFIMTNPNGLYPLFHRDEVGEFDLLTLRESFDLKVEGDSGKEKVLQATQRFYMPSEITWRLKNLGFKNIGIFGGRLDSFSRETPLTPDDFEMLVVAEKHLPEEG